MKQTVLCTYESGIYNDECVFEIALINGVIDTDGDGIIDALDGSTTDTDSDGVMDEIDTENNNPNHDTDGDGYSN